MRLSALSLGLKPNWGQLPIVLYLKVYIRIGFDKTPLLAYPTLGFNNGPILLLYLYRKRGGFPLDVFLLDTINLFII